MSAASTPSSAPKTMSSRLLTMKFMQRAAHSSPTSSAPSTPSEPTPKRRRTDSASTPSRVNVDSLADRTAIQAALADEEAKREAALEKQATEAGDTRWVLSFDEVKSLVAAPTLALRIVPAGFANLDASPSKIKIEDEGLEDAPSMVGRRSFGKFNRALEKQQHPSLDSSESSSEEDEEDESENNSDSDSDDPTSELIKTSRREAAERVKVERKAKKRAAQAELEKAAKKRRKNDVNLNGPIGDGLAGLTSLSGRPAPPKKDISCYNCGGPHLKRDCTQSKRGFHGEDDGPSRKFQRSR